MNNEYYLDTYFEKCGLDVTFNTLGRTCAECVWKCIFDVCHKEMDVRRKLMAPGVNRNMIMLCTKINYTLLPP